MVLRQLHRQECLCYSGVWQGLAVEGVDYVDGGVYFYGVAVEESGGVAPVLDGV